MKIVTVVGARPQFIKAAVVSRALAKNPRVKEILVHTGQHYDENMSNRFFKELEIPEPVYNLGVGSASHGIQTGRMLSGIEEVLIKERPVGMLIYGDTNSTLAGALAAAKLHIPIAHVEAGLRSFNRRMPEEINRVLTDHVADYLFAPTDTAAANLMREGIEDRRIIQVGDVMYDAALFFAEKSETAGDILSRFRLNSQGYILATIHRAENTDNLSHLKIILEGLARAAEEIPVIWPLHPRTKQVIHQAGLNIPSHLHLIEPVGYMDMIALERHAAVIATDSGGVQKEAYFHRVPCVTLRNETEWVESIEAGWNRLCPLVSPAQLAETILAARGQKGEEINLYGDGKAAERIAEKLAVWEA
jgi:UDP-GlcNAc3NAcA epimerase